MYIDLTIPLYAILAVECLIVAMVSLAGYFILRQAVRSLKALIGFLQAKKAFQIRQRPRLSNVPGAA